MLREGGASSNRRTCLLIRTAIDYWIIRLRG
jgi:hypothetical protein